MKGHAASNFYIISPITTVASNAPEPTFVWIDFEIEHVPDSKIKHVDALSRHVGLVGENQLIRKELMIREQRKDLFCKKQIQNRLTEKDE